MFSYLDDDGTPVGYHWILSHLLGPEFADIDAFQIVSEPVLNWNLMELNTQSLAMGRTEFAFEEQTDEYT